MTTVENYIPRVIKAIEDLDIARKQVSPELLTPVALDAPASEQFQQLQQRQASMRLHIACLKSALSLLRERRDTLLNHVITSNLTADQTAYDKFVEEFSIDQHQADAEALLRTLQNALETDSEQFQSIRIRGLASSISKDSDTAVLEVATPQRQDRSPMDNSTPADMQSSVVQQSRHPQLQPTGTETLVSSPSQHLAIHLEKLTLPQFDGDVTQFQQFWCAFELAVHSDLSIDLRMKYLYLQNLLKGDARVVLQDLEPGQNNYYQLVQALKKRYDCPRRTRALLHQQLKDLPPATDSASDMRNTWFRISGILHALKRFEDLNRVLTIIDLVRTKFPLFIQERLNDVEFQRQADFDLRQVMTHLDNIITSRERFEQTCSRSGTYAVNRDTSTAPSLVPSPSRVQYNPSACCFCDSFNHSSRRCDQRMPITTRRKIVQFYGLCWKCLRDGHRQDQCDYPACGNCGAFHHRLLCTRTSRRSRSPRTRTSNRGSRLATRSHHSSRDSSPSRSPARDSRRSRDCPRDRYYQLREQRGYRSRSSSNSQSGSRSPSPRVRFDVPVRDTSRYSPSPERRRRPRSGSPYPGQARSSGQSLVQSDTEHQDYIQCYLRSHLYNNSNTDQGVAPALMLVKAKALNSSGQLEEIALLLDSGAQMSFITKSTAARLGLRVYDHAPITLTTFGGNEITEVSGKVDLTLVDSFDKHFTVFVRTKDQLTHDTRAPKLSTEDIEFIKQYGFDLPAYNDATKVYVNVLIGIDYLWDIITQGSSVCLPSGLVLTHTRFGSVVSGSFFRKSAPYQHPPGATTQHKEMKTKTLLPDCGN